VITFLPLLGVFAEVCRGKGPITAARLPPFLPMVFSGPPSFLFRCLSRRFFPFERVPKKHVLLLRLSLFPPPTGKCTSVPTPARPPFSQEWRHFPLFTPTVIRPFSATYGSPRRQPRFDHRFYDVTSPPFPASSPGAANLLFPAGDAPNLPSPPFFSPPALPLGQSGPFPKKVPFLICTTSSLFFFFN